MQNIKYTDNLHLLIWISWGFHYLGLHIIGLSFLGISQFHSLIITYLDWEHTIADLGTIPTKISV